MRESGYPRWMLGVVAALVAVVLVALGWLGVVNGNLNAEIACHNRYLTELSSALDARAAVSDRVAAASLAEQRALAAGAGVAARERYITVAESAQAVREAHPVPAEVSC